MKLAGKQIRQIKKFALDFYKKQDLTHGTWHAVKSVELAKYLAKKEKADIQICELGALLHQFHSENLGTVRKFLEDVDVDKNVIEQLIHCVDCSATKNIHKAKTIEAKIVFDADKLQVVGPFGLLRELSYLNSVKRIDFIRAIPKIKEIQRKCYEKLQTKTARKMAKKPYELSKRFLERTL